MAAASPPRGWFRIQPVMLKSRTFPCVAIAVALLSLAGCARRLYSGAELSRDEVAVIHAGNTTVRDIDGKFGFGSAFVTKQFEVAPGPHRVAMALDFPARSIGSRDVPAQSGIGTCVVEFVAVAGAEYRLEGQPLDTDWVLQGWDGRWEGRVHGRSRDGKESVVARCTPIESYTGLQPIPTPALEAAEAPAANAVAAPLATAPAPPPLPVPVAAPPRPRPLPSPSPTPTVASKKATGDEWIRLGSWNVRDLGADPDRDYQAMARIVADNLDVVALTEVASADGYDRLLGALGAPWQGWITDTPRPNAATPEAEYYAVLYRGDRLRPCAGWSGLRYFPDNDGGPRGSGADLFEREPAFVCLRAILGDGSAGADFVLAVYRATWADGDADAVAAEVDHVDDVFAEMSRAEPGEADLILVGQLNLAPAELEPLTTARDRAACAGSALNRLGEPTAAPCDYVLVHDPAASVEVGSGAALDVRAVAPSPAEYRRRVGDHLPVVVPMRVSGTDDD